MKLSSLRARLKGFLIGEPFAGLTFFYNLDNNRPDVEVHRELFAMAAERPDSIELIETIGNNLPDLPGYRLLRDRSTKGRQNVAVYVLETHNVTGPFWITHRETWGETKGDGQHWARESLVYYIGWMQRIVGHQPPKYTDNVLAAQWEGMTLTAQEMAPWRDKASWRALSPTEKLLQRALPRMLCWDANRRAGEAGPGPDVMAKWVGGELHNGERIDNVVTRLVKIQHLEVVTSVRRIRLKSDHKHALRIVWSVPGFWVFGRTRWRPKAPANGR